MASTDLLFENHTIKEIQEIEKKLRNDIEKKKEELRQMVGERYRDLMEAADTVTEMKDIAESVTSCIKSIEERCTHLQDSSFRGNILQKIQEKVNERRKQNSLLYTVAALMKILMDSYEKVWSFMDNKDFLNAVCLFLLARHTHSLLVLDPTYKEHKISVFFPIINSHWGSVSQLKQVLLQNCELILQTQNADPLNILGPACCQYLLSNSTMEDMLTKILEVRKNVIKSIFHPEKYAKDQICEFVIVVQSTLQVLYVLLYCGDNTQNKSTETNLMYTTLKKVISQEEKGPVALFDLNSSDTFKFLPVEIANFRPVVKDPIMPCRQQILNSKCLEWLYEIKNEFCPELAGLLTFIKSVKSISLIRQAAVSNLYETKYWDEICNKILEKPFSVWDYFLKDCFSQRIKGIIFDFVNSASSECQRNVEEILAQIGNNKNYSLEFDQSIASYVWHEASDDLVDNVAWVSRHQRNLWNSGVLSMKAMGFTPNIQRICKDLDQQMKDAVEDVSTYSQLESVEDNFIKNEKFQQQQLLFAADAAFTFPYLTEATKQYISELSLFIETTLSGLQNEKLDFGNSCRVVFLGYLSHAITQLCSHINTCLSSEKLVENIESSKGFGAKPFSSINFKECDLWKEIKQKFLDNSSLGFQIWSKSHIEQLLKIIDTEIKPGSADGLMKSLLRWDKMEIQEESEQGNAVKSVLRIPQHISMPLSSALFSFCCSLNDIGGYAIHSDVRAHISKEILHGLLKIYKTKVDVNVASNELHSRLLQVQSLQLLFDVHYLMGLMVHKDKSSHQINQLSQEIINQAVSLIDPFDMDVFAVPLQQNLKKALQKSLSLYGLLASPDQVTYLNSIKAQVSSSQMEHNIMISSTISGSRFPLLPLSSRINMTIAHEDPLVSASKETELKAMQSYRSSPNLNAAADMPTNQLKTTASFYDRVTAMSSSWFGN